MNRQLLIYIVFALIAIQQLSGQIKNGIVLYSVSMEDFYEGGIKDGKAAPELKRIYRMTADAAKNIKLELSFNNEKSIFQHQKGLNISDYEKLDDLVKYLSAKGTYFTDLTKGVQIL